MPQKTPKGKKKKDGKLIFLTRNKKSTVSLNFVSFFLFANRKCKFFLSLNIFWKNILISFYKCSLFPDKKGLNLILLISTLKKILINYERQALLKIIIKYSYLKLLYIFFNFPFLFSRYYK